MLELLDSGLIAFVLVFILIRPFVVQAFYIPSESMEPTLLKHDRILVNKFIYRLNEPQRGDIIVFEAPPQALFGSEQKDFVKRLIGLPGDGIRVRRGDGVYVNGQRLEEPAEIPRPQYDFPTDSFDRPTEEPYVVPAGCYFVLGDNRNTSNDSHKWRDPLSGESAPWLEADRLVGKAMVIFWPPPRVRLASDNKAIELQPHATMAQAGPVYADSP
ncbi:MAG: signal peptidase I [Armatimonadetes bacterium]|nr:signal peptidase I [Armatimonadota bacterium]